MSGEKQEPDAVRERAPATTVRLAKETVRLGTVLEKVSRQVEQQLEGTRKTLDAIAEDRRRSNRRMKTFQHELQKSLAPMQAAAERLAQDTADVRRATESLGKVASEVIRPAILQSERIRSILSVPASDVAEMMRSMRPEIESLFDVAFQPATAAAGGPSSTEITRRALDGFESAAREERREDFLAVATNVVGEMAEWLGLERVPRIMWLLAFVSLCVAVYSAVGGIALREDVGEVLKTQDRIIAEVDSVASAIAEGDERSPADTTDDEPASEETGSMRD